MEHCKKNLGMNSDNIFTPYIGETIDATRESHIYQVMAADIGMLVCDIR